ncbi:MAG: hypothetical protein AAB505_01545 [Patescibacteria group bacterium]
MINLLLPDDQKKRRVEHHHRLLVVSGNLTLALLVIILLVVVSLYWIVHSKRVEVEKNLVGTKQQMVEADTAKLEAEVKKINERIKHLQTNQSTVTPSLILDRLISYRQGISLQQITYLSKSGAPIAVELVGQSETRPGWLNYLERLQADPLFVEIESPVRNLIQEKNPTFTLSLKINSDQTKTK